MAINFVASGPAPQVIQHAYAGGGGVGGINPAMYAAGERSDLDYLRLLQNKSALGVTGRDIFQADQQMAAIQEHAVATAWLSQQEMTQRDVMDLKRKQNLVSMISSDDSLTPKEKSDAILQIRSGIDFGKKRLQDEQIKAQAEMRRQIAADHESKVEMRDNALAFKRAEMDDKLGVYIAPRYKLQLSEMMKDAHPELQTGTQPYDAMLTMMADEMGWTQRYTKNAKGEMVFEKDVRGAGTVGGESARTPATAKGGTEVDAAHVQGAYFSALKHVQQQAKEVDKETGKALHPELQSLDAQIEAANKIASAAGAHVSSHFGAGKEGAAKAQEAALTSLNGAKDLFASTPSFDPRMKAFAAQTVEDAQRLMQKYPPGKRPASITKKINELVDQIEQFKYNADSGATEGAKAMLAKVRGMFGGGGEPPPAPVQGNFPFGGEGSVVTTDNTTRQTPAEMIGAGLRNLRGAIFGESNPFR